MTQSPVLGSTSRAAASEMNAFLYRTASLGQIVSLAKLQLSIDVLWDKWEKPPQMQACRLDFPPRELAFLEEQYDIA